MCNFAAQVSDDFVLDLSGLPSLLPTPFNEYADDGDCIVHELIRDCGSGRTRYRTIIRKDSEEYRKSIYQNNN